MDWQKCSGIKRSYLGGQSKSLGESLGGLMSDMSHGVDSLTDISYRVRAFFDEVTLAYRSLGCVP
ncbi:MULTISPECIES: hypothetical protein [Shigella]|nr:MULTISPECIES: hypothetical protein [Shigella]EIQ35366.1 hypothetical protein SB96558_0251 [Shigella boydii 965-58]MBN4172743.1 hypothetical protein [Shigella dysenteriae]VDG91067.1 Uncharacterised protein [Shigella dysenteriae]